MSLQPYSNGSLRQTTTQPRSKTAPHEQADGGENYIGVDDHIMPADHIYPEGGHGWLVVVATFVVCFWNLGLLVSWGVFKEFLISSQVFPNADTRQLSWIGAIGICALYLVAPLVALLVKPLGIRPVWCIGIALACGGFLASSFATKVWHLYVAFGVLFGAGSGILYFASLVVLSQYFLKHRGLAAGLSGAGASVGTMALAPAWRLMLESLGFPWTLRAIAAAMFLSLCIVFVFIRPRDPRARDADSTLPSAASMSTLNPTSCSRDAGEPANAPAIFLDGSDKPPLLSSSSSPPPAVSIQNCQPLDDRPVLLGFMPSSPLVGATESTPAVPALNVAQSRSRVHDGLAPDLPLLREPRFILLWAISFIFMCGYLIPFFVIPTYATHAGISPSRAASLISISTAASLVSRIVLGITGDRLGVFNTSLACFVISSLSCFVLWYPAHDYPLLVAFMVVYGVFAGGLFLLLPIAATLIVGQDRLPTALGFSFVANALGGLVGSPIGDAIVSASGGDNRWAILFTGLTLVASTALCAVLRFTMDRRLFHLV